MNDIISIVETLLARNKFSYNLADSDSDLPDWGYERDTSGSDSDTESSDSEYEKPKRKRTTAREGKRKVTFEASSESEDELEIDKKVHRTKKTSNKKEPHGRHSEKKSIHEQEGVEQLIKQLGQMSIDDPQYSLTYYKAIKMDADVAHCVQPPRIHPVQFQASPRINTYNPPTRSNYTHPPPMMAPNNPNPFQGGPITCYGCGETGHGLRDCQPLQELIKSGVLVRDQTGRIVYRDGTIVRRERGETIIQAASRRNGSNNQSHLITMEEISEYYVSEDDTHEQSDVKVMAAEKQSKTINKARKDVFDGVLLPPRSFRPKDKENIPPKAIPVTRVTPTQVQATHSKGPVPEPVPMEISLPHEEEQVKQRPIDVRKPRNINQRLQEIEKVAIPQNQPVSKPKQRQSEISTHIGDTQVVNNILDAPITLRVREVLASSRELSEQLTDMIKRKNTRPTATAHAITSSKDRGMLIRLALECDGKTVNAIIDTGSQLNVVSKDIYQTIIRLPMNPSRTLTMNDANGGAGKLRGHVANVPLTCGNVVTHANLYIGDNVPFDLLLGQPWQRGNLVSIDEQIEGTFLIFKDPNDTGVNYELLVEQDIPNPEYGFEVNLTKENQSNSGNSIIPEETGQVAVVTLSSPREDIQTLGNESEIIFSTITNPSSTEIDDLEAPYSTEIDDLEAPYSTEIDDLTPPLRYLRSKTPWAEIRFLDSIKTGPDKKQRITHP
ncbi:hypothetical protein BDZ94DRAFT_1327646 [Collybia nuda]|uniref:CCHC-type domain-containing protein n=1 Tax=Collybia nuda TaxID=64659 RepID=A0A9P6C7X2_9AGAR|nr:hypothetical protein BDZ94DRAFT_1327646 [Collybia nuda]